MCYVQAGIAAFGLPKPRRRPHIIVHREETREHPHGGFQ